MEMQGLALAAAPPIFRLGVTSQLMVVVPVRAAHAPCGFGRLDVRFVLVKHLFDRCILSSMRGDSYTNETFGSVLALQSQVVSLKGYAGRSTSNNLADSSSGIVFEEGIFEDNSSSEAAEVIKGRINEAENDLDDSGLIPKEWRDLQVELYKPKAEKKREMRFQELENAKLKEVRANLKRERIDTGSELSDGNIIVPSQACVSQEREETTLEPSVNVGSFKSKFGGATPRNVHHEGSEVSEFVESKLDERTETAHRNRKFLAARDKHSDAYLDLLFTKDEKARLKRSAPDFSKVYSEKWPALHLLVASGQFFFLDRFLQLGIDVNALDKDGYTALQRAVLGRKETAVSQLIRAGAHVEVLDRDGASLLHYGVQTGSLNMVRLFVKRGVDVNHADKEGWTPLHLAVLTGKEEIVRHLLVSGADGSITNKDGFTPLDLCLALGRGFNSYTVAKSLKKLQNLDLSS